MKLGLGLGTQGVFGPWWQEGDLYAADFVLRRFMAGGMEAGFADVCAFGRAGNAYAHRSDGHLMRFGAGAARLTAEGLLLEGAAANAVRHSSGLGQPASWARTGFANVTGQILALGELVLEQCTVTATSGQNQWSQFVGADRLTLEDGEFGVVSHYAKAGQSPRTRTHAVDGAGATATIWSWTDGVPSVNATIVNNPGRTSHVGSGSQRIGGDVWRVWTAFRNVSGMALSYGATVMISDADPNPYASACWIGGNQLEVGETPSSLIPTSGSVGQRRGDSLSLLLPQAGLDVALFFAHGSDEIGGAGAVHPVAFGRMAMLEGVRAR